MIRPKNDDDFDKMYDEINEKDLIYCKIDRDLLRDIINKMCCVCDYYFENYACKYLENPTEKGLQREKKIYENDLLCYKIYNNDTIPEAATRNTILSILAVCYSFISLPNNKRFTELNFYGTVGINAVWDWKNIKLTDDYMIEYYKIYCHITDGQPFTSKYWFFNKPDLMDKIHNFLKFKFN